MSNQVAQMFVYRSTAKLLHTRLLGFSHGS